MQHTRDHIQNSAVCAAEAPSVCRRKVSSIDEASALCKRNYPKARAPLRWRKVAERLMRSHCDRFQVERRGEGDNTRYFAFILPTTVIGHRMLTEDQAKAICEQHASPLPLEQPPAVIEREPGCDDDLGEEAV